MIVIGGPNSGVCLGNPWIRPEFQDTLIARWRVMKTRCYDAWLDDAGSDSLYQAHERVGEVVQRCTRSLRDGNNHVQVADKCHKEIVEAYQRCLPNATPPPGPMDDASSSAAPT